MYVIVIYDINAKRISKVHKLLRKSLYFVQNSSFEGEITKSKLEKLKVALKQKIFENEDSIIIYTSLITKNIRRQTIGVNKGGDRVII